MRRVETSEYWIGSSRKWVGWSEGLDGLFEQLVGFSIQFGDASVQWADLTVEIAGLTRKWPLRYQLSFEGLGFIKWTIRQRDDLVRGRIFVDKTNVPTPSRLRRSHAFVATRICRNKHLWKKAFVETNKRPHQITTSEKSRICRRWSSPRNWTIASLCRAFSKNKITGKM